MKFYNDWALRIMHGQFTDGHAFYGLPGYAWCLAGLYSVFGVNPFPVGLLQCAFDALTAVLIYRIGSRVFAGEATETLSFKKNHANLIGLGAALAWICFLPAQTFSMILMPTSWLLVVFWGLVWWLMNVRAPSVWRPWLLMGAGIGAMSMLVATVLFLLPLALFVIGRHVAAGRPVGERIIRGLAAAIILFAGVFAGCSPAWIHNYFVVHDPVLLSAHSGLNLYMGNNPLATGYPKIPPGLSASQEGLLRDSIKLAEQAAGHPLTRAEVSRHWSDMANKWIRENRAAWWRLMATKFGNFWNAFQYDDLSIIKLLQVQKVLPPGLRFGYIAALGLPGLIYGAWRFPRARWVAAAVLLHMAAIMPVFVTERYRLCAVPGLIIFAVYGLWQLWAWLCEARWLASTIWIAATAAAASFVSMPRSDIGMWSLDHFNTGLRALKTGNYEQAQRSLEMAYAYVQENAEINFALGTLWHEQNNEGRAIFFYKRTVDLDPQHASAWSNLGLVAFEQKNFPQAVRFFQKSIQFGPEDAKTHFLLARSLKESGQRDEALAEARRAVALQPERPEFQGLLDELQAAPDAH
jgi:tetratricopeptide (TPR) repeat protein